MRANAVTRRPWRSLPHRDRPPGRIASGIVSERRGAGFTGPLYHPSGRSGRPATTAPEKAASHKVSTRHDRGFARSRIKEPPPASSTQSHPETSGRRSVAGPRAERRGRAGRGAAASPGRTPSPRRRAGRTTPGSCERRTHRGSHGRRTRMSTVGTFTLTPTSSSTPLLLVQSGSSRARSRTSVARAMAGP